MRTTKLVLLFFGLAQLGLAAGFFTGQRWALSFWPLVEFPLSYVFIAAILAGAAAPLIWVALSGELGGLAGYALGFGIMLAGLAMAAGGFFFQGRQPGMAWFAGAMAILCLLCVAAFLNTNGYSRLGPTTPALLRWAFALQSLVLLGAGILLLMQVPNLLPWQVSPEGSLLYGCIFTGLGFYNFYALFQTSWVNAFGPLIGFLTSDLVLSVPLLSRFTGLPSGELRGQVAVSGIMVFSAALGLYYLFLNPATRLILRPEPGIR